MPNVHERPRPSGRWDCAAPFWNNNKGGYYVLHAHDENAKYIEVFVRGDGADDAIKAIQDALKGIPK